MEQKRQKFARNLKFLVFTWTLDQLFLSLLPCMRSMWFICKNFLLLCLLGNKKQVATFLVSCFCSNGKIWLHNCLVYGYELRWSVHMKFLSNPSNFLLWKRLTNSISSFLLHNVIVNCWQCWNNFIDAISLSWVLISIPFNKQSPVFIKKRFHKMPNVRIF